MNLILQRIQRRIDGVFSVLIAENGNILFKTLEHAYPNGPKIPNGVFKCVRGTHQLEGMKDPFETFEVMGIEGHSDILFHVGNYNKDSSGCILVGEDIAASTFGQMVIHSKDAFADFMDLQSGANEFQLTVEG